MTKLLQGDCLEQMKTLEDNSVDSVVTDPPYGISFMNKKWDYDVPTKEHFKEMLRVLKPGGHILCACGTRTQHRMAVNIEDAGFEIRDVIQYLYGSGFPKSHNIYKALQKKCTCGNMEAYEKTRTNQRKTSEKEAKHNLRPLRESDIQKTINPENKQGEVLQSGLSEQSTQGSMQREKPEKGDEGCKKSSLEGRDNNEKSEGELQRSEVRQVSEEVVKDGEKRRIHNGTQASDGSTSKQAIREGGSSTSQRPQSEQQQDRKPCPLCDEWGTQEIRRKASEIEGFGTALKPSVEFFTLARKPLSEKTIAQNVLKWGTGGINIDECRVGTEDNTGRPSGNDPGMWSGKKQMVSETNPQGRFPANLIHDGSDEVVRGFPDSKSTANVRHNKASKNACMSGDNLGHISYGHNDSGSASRFFYCAKASKSERNKGLEGFEEKQTGSFEGNADTNNTNRKIGANPSKPNVPRANHHPTVKPIALMKYLCRLITPTGGTVLDPYMGSGSTGIACKEENFDFIGIELDEEYFKIAEARIAKETL